jgi:hypothetical protein
LGWISKNQSNLNDNFMTGCLAIDPGNEQSAFVRICDSEIRQAAIVPNSEMREILRSQIGVPVACEWFVPRGMPTSKEDMETIAWCGRFWEICELAGLVFHRIRRIDVKLHVCGNARAKDSNISAALKDLWGPKGTKKKPGPSYGLKNDMWQALGVAVTFLNLT